MLSPEEKAIAQRAKELGKTPEEALAGIAKYRASKTPTPAPEATGSSFMQTAKDLGIGFAKGVGSTVQGTGRALQKGISSVGESAFGQNNPFPTGNSVFDKDMTASNNTQRIGKVVEFGAETLLPVGRLGRLLAEGKVAQTAKNGLVAAKDTAVDFAKDTIENFGRKVSSPSVSDATKVSLNPVKALRETGQDVVVSVGGKLKKISQVLPEEYGKMQMSVQRNIEKFTEEAQKFKSNRNPLNDPTEIVGKRVDKALDFADRKRQLIGKKMGEIEQKYNDVVLPIAEKTLDKFASTLKSIENPRFGVDTANAPIVQKLVKDFDELEAGGAKIADRLDFVRSWDRFLNDAKDAFGNFKENATVNTQIQNAVKTLKEETVEAISKSDKLYRDLRTQYSTYKKLDEIGSTLLGKTGALGDKIKGGSTVKRALKSNADAGARQFLTKLKELTGYDAIKDGDLALTAMENVGDFQGLSLLEVIKQGKSGLLGKALEKVQDTFVGDAKTRIDKFIAK